MACQFFSSDSPDGLTETDIVCLSHETKERCLAISQKWRDQADKSEAQVRRLNELVSQFVQDNKDKVNCAVLNFGTDPVRVLFGTPQVEVDFDLQHKISEFDILLVHDPVLYGLHVDCLDLSGVSVEYLAEYVKGRA